MAPHVGQDGFYDVGWPRPRCGYGASIGFRPAGGLEVTGVAGDTHAVRAWATVSDVNAEEPQGPSAFCCLTGGADRMRWLERVGQALRLRRRQVRQAADGVLRRSTATRCTVCGMLLGSVAQRRGVCPRCRSAISTE
jgi:hypothetical protein